MGQQLTRDALIQEYVCNLDVSERNGVTVPILLPPPHKKIRDLPIEDLAVVVLAQSLILQNHRV